MGRGSRLVSAFTLMLRPLALLFVSLSVASAQIQPPPQGAEPNASPSATPEAPSAESTPTTGPTATPDATPTPVPETIAVPQVTATPDAVTTPDAPATPDTATAAATPTPEATATPDASSAVSPTPTPESKEDVIPLPEGAKTDTGAPLETQDIGQPSLSAPDSSFTDPNALVPDGPPQPPGAPTVRENTEENDRKMAIRYREVRVQADKDPKVLSLYKQSETAKTDEDKRAALREYYKLLFTKMISIDPALEKKCKMMEEAYIRRLAQTRLEPTIPLNPPPTPKPLDQ